MQNKSYFIIILSLIFSFCLAVPAKINYQGKLFENNTGVTGTKSMAFTVKTEGGTTLWDSGAKSVSVVNGVYNVILEPDLATFDTSAQLVLHINIEGTDLAPDIQLISSPYSYIAKMAETVTANQTAGNSVVAAIAKSTAQVKIANGGTNANSYTNTNKYLVYDGTRIVSTAFDDASFAAAAHDHDASDINAGALVVSYGGTGATTLNGILKGNGTGAITGQASLDNLTEGTTYKRIKTVSANMLLSGGDANALHTHSGLNPGIHLHDATSINSGTFPVVRGGTGAATLNGILKGNGTGAITGYASIDDLMDEHYIKN